MNLIRLQVGVDFLERLLFGAGGPETEVAIELRQKIVTEFAKRYLKGVLDPKAVEAACYAAVAAAAKVAENYLYDYGVDSNRILKPSVKEAIHKAIDTAVTDLVDEAIQKRTPGWLSMIDERVASWKQHVIKVFAEQNEVIRQWEQESTRQYNEVTRLIEANALDARIDAAIEAKIDAAVERYMARKFGAGS